MKKYVISQFGRPHGLVGRLAGVIMAHRASNKLRNRWTVNLLNLEPSHQVLEVGCGPGIALAQIAECLEGGRVVGLDFSKTMHDMAAKRNRQAIRDGRVSLVMGSAEELDDFTEAEIPLRISGPLTDPTIAPDIEDMVKQEVKKQVEEELKDRLLDKLFRERD